jgi:hypothetical protein
VVCGFVMAEIRRPFGQRGRDKARPSKVESAFFTPPDFS